MTVSKKLLGEKRKPGLRVIKEIMVASKSVIGNWHLVKIYEDYSMDCNCIRNGFYHKECSHIKSCRKYIKKISN